jgi:hypothetical protein
MSMNIQTAILNSIRVCKIWIGEYKHTGNKLRKYQFDRYSLPTTESICWAAEYAISLKR